MLSRDWREILSAFIDANVEFLLVGAHALAAHGLVRGTGDLDLWVRSTPDNAARVHRALLAFGAPADRIAPSDFATPDAVVQIGVAPHRIDVVTGLTGIQWEDAWAHRLVVSLEGLQVPVLGRDQLIANKRATNRPRDVDDLRWLEREER